jgi:chromate reductase, NAD(P)H dehydrogenase (quinone)
MNTKIRIVGMSGSLRSGSFNTGLLRAAVESAPADIELEVLEIGNLPLFNQDMEMNPPEVVKIFKSKIQAADAVLFSSPEYNYSMSGVLKNAIDWASRPYGDNSFEGKPAAIMGGSIGNIATARMQYHLRQTMVFLDMHPLNRPEVMVPMVQDKFDADGRLMDAHTREKIVELLEALAAWTRRLG